MTGAGPPSTTPGRVVAVDYGRKRIGLATTDALRIALRGLPTVVRTTPHLEDAVRTVAQALREQDPTLVVVGLPLHEDGSESEMSREARTFASALGAAMQRPVALYHEGLTSWEAEERLRDLGLPLPQARRSGRLDQEAAKILLAAWLREPSAIDGGDAPADESGLSS